MFILQWKNKEVVFNDAVIKETLIVPSCPEILEQRQI